MSLLEQLKVSISEQKTLQDEEYAEIMQRPVTDRISKGYTITNLQPEFEFFDEQPSRYVRKLLPPLKYIKSATFHCDTNTSKFREGSQVWLSNGKIKLKMDVEFDGATEFKLRSGDFDVKNNILNTNDFPKDNWEINIENSEITNNLLNATHDTLFSNPDLNEHFESLLSGTFENDYTNAVYDCKSGNNSQNEAIKKSLGCSYFHLIQGPPGTGKTYTIAQIAKILVENGKKVFITAPTHTAINNCLNALSANLQNKSQIVKLGEKYQAEEIRSNQFISFKRSLRISNYEEDNNLSHNGIAVGATPFALCYPASKKLEGWFFDYIIIDESAQMSIPLALSAMIFGEHVIFVGDHKQLDPIIHRRCDYKNGETESFNCSIFSKLTELYPNDVTLLDTSYRLNDELIRIPNMLFYDGKLSSECNTLRPFVDFNCKRQPEIVCGESSELLILHHEFDSLGRSRFEADLVADIVADLLDNGVSVEQIGILTPYRAQVREIKAVISSRDDISKDNLEEFFVDTVERMQGQERDYVIFSMSNSNPSEVEDRLEFFYSPNRLNVAITRAKVKNFVIANEKVFDFLTDADKNFMDSFLKFKELSTKFEVKDEDDDW